MEITEEKEIKRFVVWYNHDGVKRAADVRHVEMDNQAYYKCRLFNGTEIDIEPIADEQELQSWKLVMAGVTPLSVKLGKAIEGHKVP